MSFVTVSSGKQRLVIYYKYFKTILEDRIFRMEQWAYAAPLLRRYKALLKSNVNDSYYHLRLRAIYQPYLSFSVAGGVYIPI